MMMIKDTEMIEKNEAGRSGKMEIRQAKQEDIPALADLLLQVHAVHSGIRPDLFAQGQRKYSDEELSVLLENPNKPVFAAWMDGKMMGYVFCEIQDHRNDHSLTDTVTLYIDDLCVDEKARGHHIGKVLFDFTVEQAKTMGCYNVTLNVWQGNDSARAFYDACGMQVQKTGMELILESE